ncbi:MAG: hypothetical protein ACRDXD_04935 [Acidimicrobiia bacterium]
MEVAGLYVAAFLMAAAIGIARPWWHWSVPIIGMWAVPIYGLLSGPELAVAVLCAFLGVASDPLGWAIGRQGLASGSPELAAG